MHDHHPRLRPAVLIAEDEEPICKLAAMTIKSRGFEVLTASSAEEALEVWAQHSEEIVLFFTDVVLPGPLSGIDVAKKIRANSSDLPIIFSSGHGREQAESVAEFHTGVQYLPKPYRQTELATLISAILGTQPTASAAA